MNLNIPFSLPPTLLVLLVAVAGAGTVYSLLAVTGLHRRLGPGPARTVGAYLEREGPGDAVTRLGGWTLSRFPVLGRLGQIERHRRWLALAGEAPSHASLVGTALLLAGMGMGLALLSGAPIALGLAGLGAVYPFARLASQARKVQRSVQRALPELTALMAAEMAAGNPPDKALERAIAWGGPLANLVGEAVRQARNQARPLLSRSSQQPGMLLETADRYGLASLRAFAAQLDLTARKGTSGPELMSALARMLVLEYKEKSLRDAEALDSRLAVPTVLFFFLPFLFLILTPLLMPVMELL
jgi:Flp pilus assembly protein TadB